ncbi:MAG TPA: MarR family transcriptional regulator [Gemmatimonadaceae bacterium]
MKTSAAAHLRSLDTSDSVSKEVAEALQNVRALVEGLSKSAQGVESRTGVTNAQLFLLQQIRTGRHLTVNDLAARALTTQSTVSIVLSRLERKGLVKRTRSPVDRRSVVLQLTATGKRVLRRAPRAATSEVMGALARLTTAELHALSHGLRALGRELGLAVKPPSMLFEEDGRRQTPAQGTKGQTRRKRA